MRTHSVDFAIFVRAFLLLVRRPSVAALPLLAGVGQLLIAQLSNLTTGALGGIGQGIYQFLGQLLFGFCFAGAIIQADNLLRGRRGSFDDAWVEARTKAGSILMAVIGFVFLINIAAYVGQVFGAFAMILVQLAVAFFLIFTIPAAAIGGFPGALAISASIRCVRANVVAAAALAIAFILLFTYLPVIALAYFGQSLTPNIFILALAAIQASALAYLAFPFAKLYDDTAFRGFH